jgi:hypothetical protein
MVQYLNGLPEIHLMLLHQVGINIALSLTAIAFARAVVGVNVKLVPVVLVNRTHAFKGMRCRYQFFAVMLKEFAERNFALQLLGVDFVCLIAASGNPGFVFRAFTKSVYCSLLVFSDCILWFDLHNANVAHLVFVP